MIGLRHPLWPLFCRLPAAGGVGLRSPSVRRRAGRDLGGESVTARSYDPAPVLALFDSELSEGAVAVQLGVSGSVVGRWRRGDRGISDRMADRVATRLGRHPCELWPEWFGGAA